MEGSVNGTSVADDSWGELMKRFILLSIGISLVIFPLMGYTYLRGCMDGVARYQQSKRFALTLYSMYMFGFKDGAASCGGK